MRSVLPRRGPVVAIVLVALAAASGCSSSAKSSSPATTVPTPTTAAATAPGGTVDQSLTTWRCRLSSLGQVLPEALAVVDFDAKQVCPSYITVAKGTKVRWRNHGDTPAVVTVYDNLPDRGGKVLAHGVASRTALFGWTPTTAGMSYFTISIVNGFRGNVESK